MEEESHESVLSKTVLIICDFDSATALGFQQNHNWAGTMFTLISPCGPSAAHKWWRLRSHTHTRVCASCCNFTFTQDPPWKCDKLPLDFLGPVFPTDRETYWNSGFIPGASSPTPRDGNCTSHRPECHSSSQSQHPSWELFLRGCAVLTHAYLPVIILS